jgi:hypothetical protein
MAVTADTMMKAVISFVLMVMLSSVFMMYFSIDLSQVVDRVNRTMASWPLSGHSNQLELFKRVILGVKSSHVQIYPRIDVHL